LISLAVLSGLSPAETVLVILADIFMIVTGLLSSVTDARHNAGDRAKWFYYAISCTAFLMIFIVLYIGGRKAAALRPKKTRGLFMLLALMTFM
jgi:bacteriorhodopsin